MELHPFLVEIVDLEILAQLTQVKEFLEPPDPVDETAGEKIIGDMTDLEKALFTLSNVLGGVAINSLKSIDHDLIDRLMQRAAQIEGSSGTVRTEDLLTRNIQTKKTIIEGQFLFDLLWFQIISRLSAWEHKGNLAVRKDFRIVIKKPKPQPNTVLIVTNG